MQTACCKAAPVALAADLGACTSTGSFAGVAAAFEAREDLTGPFPASLNSGSLLDAFVAFREGVGVALGLRDVRRAPESLGLSTCRIHRQQQAS